jgi:uncharacterized protein YozE (UPF0346 family)
MSDSFPITQEDFNVLCDDLETLTGGHDHLHVLDNPDYYDAHTVRLAKTIDVFDCLLLLQELGD